MMMKCSLKRLTLSMLALTAAAPVCADTVLTDVPNANSKTPGMVAPNVLSPELDQRLVATGSMALENPTALLGWYGYNNNGSFVPVLNAGVMTEASKTEPDKNTFLRLRGQTGADAGYDYGSAFLFQGHETGQQGYVTRINLDADAAHRVTLMASTDVNGTPLPTFDGSTWNPFAQVLLFTAEAGSGGGVWQGTVTYPSDMSDISGVMGRGGYEGIQTDGDGNIWIVEDVGGSSGTGANTSARRPNSFIYRFVPVDRSDLTRGGRLQALQVMNHAGTAPILYDATLTPDQAAFTQNVADLHTYGLKFKTRWVTLHNTATDGFDPFDANALAKARGATPFKRPENGVFQPGTGFRNFYFTETGDTNMNSSANTGFGGYGGLYVIHQSGGPSANTGNIEMFYSGDAAHSGFDNITFAGARSLMVVEDAGDTLHSQRNALDSGYLFDVGADYSGGRQPIRFLAEGRDPSATLDSGMSGLSGFQNEGDNEITGIHVSDGDPTVRGLLGAKIPVPFSPLWRVFYTQQHGDNNTWEVVFRNFPFVK